jgi:hypothetical protein
MKEIARKGAKAQRGSNLFTTKITKNTKLIEECFEYDFLVLFVTFVVQVRRIPCAFAPLR